MNNSHGKRQRTEAERADGVRAGTLSRRAVLAGIAAVPVTYGIGSATPALAATATQPGNAPSPIDDLVRGVERRYRPPLLIPGTRLVLPAGIKAVPIHDSYHRPRLASATSAWPRMRAADGTTIDASIVPGRGAATRIAMLSGFAEGWYELRYASGRADRVTWDARTLPFLWFYGEFGGTDDAPYRDRIYTVALQPFSRNPYSGITLAE